MCGKLIPLRFLSGIMRQQLPLVPVVFDLFPPNRGCVVNSTVRMNSNQKRYYSASTTTSTLLSTHSSTQEVSSSTTFEDRVITTIDKDGIAHVILNRANKMNALDMPMFHALQQAALFLKNEKTVRVVILRGEGRAFCAGLDILSILKNRPLKSVAKLLERQPLPSSPTVKSTHQSDVDDSSYIPNLSDAAQAVAITSNLAQDVGYLWRQLPVPVLCSIHGMCLGGGLQIALGADIRLCHNSNTQLSVMESKWGLIPDMSASVTLRELVRIDIAKELTFTGRMVSGVEAKELGLVTQCVDNPLQEAERLAQAMIQKNPDALRLTKQLYQQTWVAAKEEYCLQLETEFQKKLLLSWNQIAASARNYGWKVPYFLRKE